MRAAQMRKEQTARDVKHHQDRIDWLQGEEAPKYSDGTPLSEVDRIEMLRVSKEVIANPRLGYNTGPQGDSPQIEQQSGSTVRKTQIP